MNKYINADELNAKIYEEYDPSDDDYVHIGIGIVQDLLNGMPSADVVEVKHGKWRGRKNSFNNIYYLCSLCGGDSPFKANFCPNCGADMRGER